MRHLRLVAIGGAAALFLLLAACQPRPAMAPTHNPVTREHTGYCVQTCKNLGMQMTAMVVIMSSTGCVCQPAGGGAADSSTSGAAAASSGAAIAAATAAAAEAEEQRRRAAARQQQ